MFYLSCSLLSTGLVLPRWQVEMLHYSSQQLALPSPSDSRVIIHCSLLYYTSSTAICKHLSVRWEFLSEFNLKWECSVIRGRTILMQKKKELRAKMKRITDGLPVFWLVDREYDSWRGGLLLDGGQEGKLTFTPEQLHHFFCDMCWGVNCSPNIWRNKIKQKVIMSLFKV